MKKAYLPLFIAAIAYACNSTSPKSDDFHYFVTDNAQSQGKMINSKVGYEPEFPGKITVYDNDPREGTANFDYILINMNNGKQYVGVLNGSLVENKLGLTGKDGIKAKKISKNLGSIVNELRND